MRLLVGFDSQFFVDAVAFQPLITLRENICGKDRISQKRVGLKSTTVRDANCRPRSASSQRLQIDWSPLSELEKEHIIIF